MNIKQFKFHRNRLRSGVAAFAAISAVCFASAASPEKNLPDTGEKIAEAIRAEATRAPFSKEGRPFPLAATWAPLSHNFSPDYQLGLIKQGHHLLLCFQWPYADWQWGEANCAMPKYVQMRLDNFEKNFAPALREAARLHLPISFYRFQFEMELTSDKKYFDLPPEKNPNVIGLDGKVQKMVDPMSPIEAWKQLGEEQVTSACMKLAQEIYPDPPLVIMLSNNEHPVLNFHEAEKSQRYLDKYGKGKDAAFRSKLFADESIKHYRALTDAMREGLTSKTWKKNVKFVAYDAFGPREFGRYGGWQGHGGFLPELGRMTWQHLAWDGGSPSYYTDDWNGILTDFTSSSTQIETMNWVFMLNDVYKENPDYWFELSTWDGDNCGFNSKRVQYAGRGQIYDGDRYQGMLQYGLWLTRARALRDFRYMESLAYAEQYYMANVKAVDQVYASPIFQKFWRKGELVPNATRQHPYQVALTDELKKRERWYLLETNLESPDKNWGFYTEIPVFPLALVLGQEPKREWLVFAHAPRGARTDVTVKLPGFGDIVINASVTGSFYHVKEQGKSVECLVAGGPVSALPVALPETPKAGEATSFKASNVFNSIKGVPALEWDFMDGTKAAGAEASHAFSKKGLYVVSLTAKNEGGESSVHYLPVPVGYPAMESCLLFLPLDKTPDIGTSWEVTSGGGGIREIVKANLVFAANTKSFSALNVGCDWAEDAERGQVLHLPGKNSYVGLHPFYNADTNKEIPRYDALGRNRTISFWFKADETQSRQVIYQDGSSNENVMNIYLDNGLLYAGTSSGKANEWQGSWLSTPVEAGKWQHVALVLDNADPEKLTDCFKLYLNGKLVGQGKGLLNRPNWARIGGGWATRFHDGTKVLKNAETKGSVSLNGYVDDFAVFTKALNEEEINNLIK